MVRHGISCLPNIDGRRRSKKAFEHYSLEYFRIDIAEVRTEEGKLHLFVALDRTSKVAYAELHPRATKMIAAQFLRNFIEAIPYQLHTVLTDNGIGFTNRKKDKFAFAHIFDRVYVQYGIEHRLTKPNHPWTNGQVERMNRTLQEATEKRYHH